MFKSILGVLNLFHLPLQRYSTALFCLTRRDSLHNFRSTRHCFSYYCGWNTFSPSTCLVRTGMLFTFSKKIGPAYGYQAPRALRVRVPPYSRASSSYLLVQLPWYLLSNDLNQAETTGDPMRWTDGRWWRGRLVGSIVIGRSQMACRWYGRRQRRRPADTQSLWSVIK